MAQTILYQNSSLAYHIAGTGPTVFLLHGFAEDSQIFNHQVAFLQDYCRVIVPDLPGSGASMAIKDMSIDGMADAMAALIQSTTNSSVIILGHSMGGYITLALVEKYPELVKAFGLLHSTAFADTEEKKAGRRKSIAFMQQHGAFAFLQTAIPGLFAEGYQKDHAEAVATLVAAGKQFTKENLIAYYQAMIQRPDRTPVLAGSKTPVLFVLGAEDKAVLLQDVLKQIHLPDVSYFHVLKNIGHMGMWEATSQMNSFILKFITDFE